LVHQKAKKEHKKEKRFENKDKIQIMERLKENSFSSWSANWKVNGLKWWLKRENDKLWPTLEGGPKKTVTEVGKAGDQPLIIRKLILSTFCGKPHTKLSLRLSSSVYS